MTLRDETADNDRLVADVATAEDALVDGDRALRPGSARSALSHKAFRTVYFGAFASNIGSWMQNVVLAAYAQELTGSPTFVGIIIFAQLGPLLFVTPFGGLLADALDRRRLLLIAQVEQMVLSLVLAALAWNGDPSKWTLVAIVFGIGMGQAINAPTWSAMLPGMVGRRDLPGAISLNSAQMNASRVVGPVIGGVLFPAFGPGGVFVVNAATYLFAIWALVVTKLPDFEKVALRGQGWRQMAGGLIFARRDPLVGRALVILFSFSLISLVFVGQMPVVAEHGYGFQVRTLAYGVLYACFGSGAMLGSIALGTVWSDRPKGPMVRWSLVAFSLFLTPFALIHTKAAAFPLAFAVGFAYFTFITALSTVVQADLEDKVRGRVMALWIMGFGGTVPIGNLIAGPIIEATTIGTVMVVGAAWALVLAWLAEPQRLSPRT